MSRLTTTPILHIYLPMGDGTIRGASGSVDCFHLVNRIADTTLTPLERKIATRAQANGNGLLEIEDFLTPRCRKLFDAPACWIERTTVHAEFTALRNTLIEQILQDTVARHTFERSFQTFLQSAENRAILVRIVDRYAHGVVDIGRMVSRLLNAIDESTSDADSYRLLAATIWTIMYNLGKLHEQWIAQGGRPILPKKRFEAFMRKSLERLEHQDVIIGYARREMQEHARIYYDAQTNALRVPTTLFDAPDKPHIDLVGPLAETIPHEMFHAEQDARRRAQKKVPAEEEAHILGMKALLLDHGSRRAVAIQEQLWQRSVESLSQCVVEDNPALCLFLKADEKNHTLRLRTMTLGIAEIAQKELVQQRKDAVGRKSFRAAYAISGLYGFITEQCGTAVQKINALSGKAEHVQRAWLRDTLAEPLPLWKTKSRRALSSDDLIPKIQAHYAQAWEISIATALTSRETYETFATTRLIPTFFDPNLVRQFSNMSLLADGIGKR